MAWSSPAVRGALGSLRGRLLALVLLGVVVPLIGVGVWLTGSARRAGRTLLETQLDGRLERTSQLIGERWAVYRSDVRLLAENEPVRLATLARSDTPPSYVREAFAGMSGISRVTYLTPEGAPRWRLGASPVLDAGDALLAANAPVLLLGVPIVDEATGSRLGTVEARIIASALLGEDAGASPADAFIALRVRNADAWVGGGLPPLHYLTEPAFEWNGQRWLTRRQSLAEPAVDLVAGGRLDLIIRPFTRSAKLGAFALAAVVLVVSLLAVIGSRRLTASLSELSTAADAVARGDLERSLPFASTDEVGRVARAFNSMTESLRQMMLERSQREAVSAVGELAATVAHQIRSPLTAMKLNLQRAEEALETRGAAEGALVGQALKDMSRVERAVGASLRIARTGSGHLEPVNLRAAIEEALASGGARASLAGIRIAVEYAPEPIALRGDPGALVQMLGNVITNAIEAARSAVSISLAAENGAAVIRVTDDGPGIPAHVLERVGQPFFSTKPSGTGLGLAIARRVAEAHGGAVQIASAPSEGTTVEIRIAREV